MFKEQAITDAKIFLRFYVDTMISQLQKNSKISKNFEEHYSQSDIFLEQLLEKRTYSKYETNKLLKELQEFNTDKSLNETTDVSLKISIIYGLAVRHYLENIINTIDSKFSKIKEKIIQELEERMAYDDELEGDMEDNMMDINKSKEYKVLLKQEILKEINNY